MAPTAITLHQHRPEGSSARNLWQGTISGLELLIDRVRVAVDGSPGVVVDVTAAAVAELGLAPEVRVWLTAKATEARAYRATDGEPGQGRSALG